jgi:hypothetical protein
MKAMWDARYQQEKPGQAQGERWGESRAGREVRLFI